MSCCERALFASQPYLVAVAILYVMCYCICLIISHQGSLPHLDQRSRCLQESSLPPPLPPVSDRGEPSLWAGSDRRNSVSERWIPFYVHAAPVQSNSPGGHCPHWLLRKCTKPTTVHMKVRNCWFNGVKLKTQHCPY